MKPKDVEVCFASWVEDEGGMWVDGVRFAIDQYNLPIFVDFAGHVCKAPHSVKLDARRGCFVVSGGWQNILEDPRNQAPLTILDEEVSDDFEIDAAHD